MAFSLTYRRLVEAVLAVGRDGSDVLLRQWSRAVVALMWFAPLPLLWFALRSKWWTAAVTAVAVMMLTI